MSIEMKSRGGEGFSELDDPENNTGTDQRRKTHHQPAVHTFFAKGRDFETQHTNHVFTEEELDKMAGFESMNYLPQNNELYRKFLKKQKQQTENHWDKWFLMGLIGFVVGILSFLLKSLTEVITEAKVEFTREALKDGRLAEVFGWMAGISVLMVAISSSLVVFVAPEAAGSGVPGVIGYLNGVYIHHLFDLRVFAVKFVSTCLSVASGLPVGPEGPMVNMGCAIAKQLSNGDERLGCWTRTFRRFRNLKARRDFISAGAGAGIAAAFGAPVGGLLFALEEVASFWNFTLAWQIFFCCMVATFTTDVMFSAFGKFERSEVMFGTIKKENGIIFGVNAELPINILIFIPTIILGALGGLFGAVFTFFNLKINRWRKRVVEPRQWARVLEPVLIVLFMSAIAVYLPNNFACKDLKCARGVNCTFEPEAFTCDETEQYNPAASLFFTTGESAVERLFSRKTFEWFDGGSLVAMLVCYFPMAMWCAGSAVSSGLVVPILIIGASIGRLLGVLTLEITGDIYTQEAWSWLDPGAFALIGSAAFFGGVSRLTISLTVIMMEITNDIRFLLPIMGAVLVGKLVADQLTHSLYHALLELRCIPFIGGDPPPSTTPLDLHPVSKIMARDVVTIPVDCTGGTLAAALRKSQSHAFPVVEASGEFNGLVLRKHALKLLATADFKIDTYEQLEDPSLNYFHEISSEEEEAILKKADNGQSPASLRTIVDNAALTLREDFPIERAYVIFRALGLRHLPVLNKTGKLVGIVTRKELIGMHIETSLHHDHHE